MALPVLLLAAAAAAAKSGGVAWGTYAAVGGGVGAAGGAVGAGYYWRENLKRFFNGFFGSSPADRDVAQRPPRPRAADQVPENFFEMPPIVHADPIQEIPLAILPVRALAVDPLEGLRSSVINAFEHHKSKSKAKHSKTWDSDSDRFAEKFLRDCKKALENSHVLDQYFSDQDFQRLFNTFLCGMDEHEFKGNDHSSRLGANNHKQRIVNLNLFFKTILHTLPRPETRLGEDRSKQFTDSFYDTFSLVVDACYAIQQELVNRRQTRGERVAAAGAAIANNLPVQLNFAVPLPDFMKLDVNANKLVAVCFELYGYFCRISNEREQQRLMAISTGYRGHDRAEQIYEAAKLIAKKYQAQIMQLLYVGPAGVEDVAKALAVSVIKYLSSHSDAHVLSAPGFWGWAKHTVMGGTVPAKIYRQLTDTITHAACYSDLSSTESVPKTFLLLSGQVVNASTFFRNVRIRENETGELYTTTAIEKDSLNHGLDMGEHSGDQEEVKARGFKTMTVPELSRYMARGRGLSIFALAPETLPAADQPMEELPNAAIQPPRAAMA